MSRTLPGDLTSPTAGPILRRGAPVICTFADMGYRAPGEVTRGLVSCRRGDGWDVVGFDGWVSGDVPTLALDLTDPAGMDLAARWLARHHGLTVGATAPRWRRSDRAGSESYDPIREGFWSIWWAQLAGHQYHDLPDWPDVARRTRLPGISAVTDPAEALALACLAAGNR